MLKKHLKIVVSFLPQQNKMIENQNNIINSTKTHYSLAQMHYC